MTIKLRRVHVQLSGVDVLRGVDLCILPGVTALVGRNGAGKTTLIRTICGLLAPTSGVVLRDGIDIGTDRETLMSHRRRLGWMPQEPGAPPRMRVESLVAYAAWLKEIPARNRPEVIDAALAEVDLVEERRQRLGQLSGGQRRRASLAAAIVGGPELLVLDEPTNGLDPLQREHFLSSIRALAADRTVLVATHLLEDVTLVADRWCAIDAGLIAASGDIDRSSSDAATASMNVIRSAMATHEHLG